MTFQERLRDATSGLMSQIGQRVWQMGVHPDTITIVGFLLTVVASFQILSGQLQLAAIILVIGLPLDALDGAVARAMNQPQRKFGGVLDSTLDRYSDGLLFGGLIFFFLLDGNTFLAMASLFALLGAFTTSYVRSRAALAGYEVKGGLIDRLVRVIALLVGLGVPSILPVIVVALAVLGNLTTLQRLVYARQHLP